MKFLSYKWQKVCVDRATWTINLEQRPVSGTDEDTCVKSGALTEHGKYQSAHYNSQRGHGPAHVTFSENYSRDNFETIQDRELIPVEY